MCWGMTLCGRNGGNKIEQKIYGYIRVSTREQNEDRQVIALREVGVPERNVYMMNDKYRESWYNRSSQSCTDSCPFKGGYRNVTGN